MLLTPHVFVGIAVATLVPQPLAAVPISFGLHFAGDKLPHWDFYSNTTKEERTKGWRPLAVMADFAAGIAVGLTATLYALWVLGEPLYALSIFLCGIASVLPDAITAPSIYMENPPKFIKFISKLQSASQTQARLPWGAITQVIVVLVCSFLILNSPR